VPTLLTGWWADVRNSSAAEAPNLREESRAAPRARSADERLEILVGILRTMDADENGALEPDEVSEDAWPYIERWARLAELDPADPLPIKALEAALGDYYRDRDLPSPRRAAGAAPAPPARRGAGAAPVSPAAGTAVLGFGQVENLPPILGFGADAEQLANVSKADLDAAGEALRRYDANHDGYIDRREVRGERWFDEAFRYDTSHDDRLSLYELAARYAGRRAAEAGRDGGPSSRGDGGRRDRDAAEEARRRAREEEESRRRQDPRNREAWYLSGNIVARYDANHNGLLERTEWENLAGEVPMADIDGRGAVDRAELVGWLLEVAAKSAGNLPLDLPEWFRQRDANADGQVTMAEFSQEWTEEKVVEFERYDPNQDGIVTPEECVGANVVPQGTYQNRQFYVISAGQTVQSEILVPDGEPVTDLDVQISITHTRDESLDAFLIGPYGERIELFTGVGGEDDHFDNTVFDDEAQAPITGGRPPFRGRFRPEAAARREPSLRQFYGKPIGGTWTLMIRAQRSDRPGALHGWSLIATSAEQAKRPDQIESAPEPVRKPLPPGPPPRRRGEGRRPLER
jgi:subtilisin-like proprotein convertase family protein/Ca2+-binding EF-hand superfamily protein